MNDARPDYLEKDFLELGGRAALVLALENAAQPWNAQFCVTAMAWAAERRSTWVSTG